MSSYLLLVMLLFFLLADLGIGQWVGGGSGGSSPLPSPTSTPTPQLHHSSTSLWGGLPTSTTTTPLLPHLSRPLHLDPISPTCECMTSTSLPLSPSPALSTATKELCKDLCPLNLLSVLSVPVILSRLADLCVGGSGPRLEY